MDKTKIKMKNNDPKGKWKSGDEGYIDGYVVKNDEIYLAIVLSKKIVFAISHQVEVIDN
jgi:hypothetical protein